jgi:hypothetical protein
MDMEIFFYEKNVLQLYKSDDFKTLRMCQMTLLTLKWLMVHF